jgi:protocatechuate 3,4-dioxygenase beta subunit
MLRKRSKQRPTTVAGGTQENEALSEKALARRSALKGLGVFAVAAPTFVSACSDPAAGGGSGGSSGSGGSGSGGSGSGGAASGGAPGSGGASSGGAPGSGGAASGGAPGSGGAASGGAPGSGGAASGGAPGSGGAASGGAAGGAGGPGAGGSGGSVGMMTSSPPWTNVPIQDSTNADMPKMLMCNTVTKRDGAGQGPFFIHELEKDTDISLVRQDIRGQYNMDATKGVDMDLFVRIIDKSKSDAACGMLVPVSDVEVYIWHTDAQGYYSGFGKRGTSDEQKPDTPYAGVPSSMNLENDDRFLRGIQTTDSNGVVGFQSVYPGWYNGRDLHIHIVIFKKGSKSHGRVDYSKSNEPMWVFTTQFYFDPSFTKSIHEAYEPYKTRTKLSAYQGSIAADESGNSGRHCTATKSGDKVTAQIQIVVDPS